MLKTHEFEYISGRKNSLRSRRLGRRGHINRYRVQMIRSENAEFLIDPDRKIDHQDKVEVAWTRS